MMTSRGVLGALVTAVPSVGQFAAGPRGATRRTDPRPGLFLRRAPSPSVELDLEQLDAVLVLRSRGQLGEPYDERLRAHRVVEEEHGLEAHRARREDRPVGRVVARRGAHLDVATLTVDVEGESGD